MLLCGVQSPQSRRALLLLGDFGAIRSQFIVTVLIADMYRLS